MYKACSPRFLPRVSFFVCFSCQHGPPINTHTSAIELCTVSLFSERDPCLEGVRRAETRERFGEGKYPGKVRKNVRDDRSTYPRQFRDISEVCPLNVREMSRMFLGNVPDGRTGRTLVCIVIVVFCFCLCVLCSVVLLVSCLYIACSCLVPVHMLVLVLDLTTIVDLRFSPVRFFYYFVSFFLVCKPLSLWLVWSMVLSVLACYCSLFAHLGR